MPTTSTVDLRGLANDELVSKLREAKEELFNLRFQAATGQRKPWPSTCSPQGNCPSVHRDARTRIGYHAG